jgi:glycine hydroxymethyltransferase
LGTPALTTRGLSEAQMPQVATWIGEAVDAAAKDDEPTLTRVAGQVRDLLSAYPMPGWSA